MSTPLTIRSVGRRASEVDEGVIVKGGQQFVRHRGQQGGGGGPRGETGVHPTLHGHHQYRTLEVRPVVDGRKFGHGISVLIMDVGGKMASLAAQPGNRVGIDAEVEAVVTHGTGDVAGVHALQDARQLPVSEGQVELQVAQIPTGRRLVAVLQVGSRWKTGHERGGVTEGRVLAGLGPVHEQLAQIGERVSQRAQLPVEYGQHVALPTDDAVVQAVVAVDDGGVPLLGNVSGQLIVDRVDVRVRRPARDSPAA